MTTGGEVYAQLSPICGLCQMTFREGEAFKAIYQRRTGPSLSITVHARCFQQLQRGDLTLVFQSLERGLELPLAVLRGRNERRGDAEIQSPKGEGSRSWMNTL